MCQLRAAGQCGEMLPRNSRTALNVALVLIKIACESKGIRVGGKNDEGAVFLQFELDTGSCRLKAIECCKRDFGAKNSEGAKILAALVTMNVISLLPTPPPLSAVNCSADDPDVTGNSSIRCLPL
ncbi:hypothetical protein J6590_039673 [Homalodisca vitripennis]|nr:hypothetical protein J6590_039673 [Homalodisca vitripennis]